MDTNRNSRFHAASKAKFFFFGFFVALVGVFALFFANDAFFESRAFKTSSHIPSAHVEHAATIHVIAPVTSASSLS